MDNFIILFDFFISTDIEIKIKVGNTHFNSSNEGSEPSTRHINNCWRVVFEGKTC